MQLQTPRPIHCPDCDSTVANVQGLRHCPDCQWTRAPDWQ